MTTPEQIPAKRHRQIFDDRTGKQTEPEHEATWVNDFIARLAGALRSIGGKSKK